MGAVLRRQSSLVRPGRALSHVFFRLRPLLALAFTVVLLLFLPLQLFAFATVPTLAAVFAFAPANPRIPTLFSPPSPSLSGFYGQYYLKAIIFY